MDSDLKMETKQKFFTLSIFRATYNAALNFLTATFSNLTCDSQIIASFFSTFQLICRFCLKT